MQDYLTNRMEPFSSIGDSSCLTAHASSYQPLFTEPSSSLPHHTTLPSSSSSHNVLPKSCQQTTTKQINTKECPYVLFHSLWTEPKLELYHMHSLPSDGGQSEAHLPSHSHLPLPSSSDTQPLSYLPNPGLVANPSTSHDERRREGIDRR